VRKQHSRQHFAVKCHKLADDRSSDDEGPNEFSTQQDAAPFTLWQASTWLYHVIIHDSKKDIDKEIRSRRAQKIRDQAKYAALRARQALVNITADAAKPEIALGDRFKILDRRIDTLKEDVSLMQRGPGRASTKTSTKTSATDDASPQTTDSTPAPIQNLERIVLQLQRTVQTLQVSAPQDT
jgi:hypothetical protein